jgi:uncharacterized protein YjiS (DUF1127 family)
MNMKATYNTPAGAQGMVGQCSPRYRFAKRLATTFMRWGTAYLTWRIEQRAAALLWSMSDRDLRDIGLTRSELEGAVKDEAARDRRVFF